MSEKTSTRKPRKSRKTAKQKKEVPVRPVEAESGLPHLYALFDVMGRIYGSCMFCGSKNGLSARKLVQGDNIEQLDPANRVMVCPDCAPAFEPWHESDESEPQRDLALAAVSEIAKLSPTVIEAERAILANKTMLETIRR